MSGNRTYEFLANCIIRSGQKVNKAADNGLDAGNIADSVQDVNSTSLYSGV